MLRNNPQKSLTETISIEHGTEDGEVQNMRQPLKLNHVQDDTKTIASKGNYILRGGKAGSINLHRLPIVDALRVLCSFIIICGHLDMLFRRNIKGRRKLGSIGDNDDNDNNNNNNNDLMDIQVALKCITTTVVQGFFNLSGLVTAIPFIHNRVETFCASLLSRPIRMLVPLALVQLVDLAFYVTDLSYFNYQSKPTWNVVSKDFSSLRLVFASSLNGPLWVMEDFFYLPYVIFPIASASNALHLSRGQRIRFFLWVAAFLQCLVTAQDDFLDRLVAGLLGVACAYYLYDEGSEEPSSEGMANILLLLGSTTPWNPLIPWPKRVWICRIAAPCAIVLVHRVVRRWPNVLHGGMERLAMAGPYTFQVYIWHHVIYGLAGKTLIPLISQDIFTYQVACIPWVWGIVGAVSYLSYHFVEQPAAYYFKARWINRYKPGSKDQRIQLPDNAETLRDSIPLLSEV